MEMDSQNGLKVVSYNDDKEALLKFMQDSDCLNDLSK